MRVKDLCQRVGLLFVAITVFACNVDAQCRRDIECKGNRVCVDGECVDPPVRDIEQPQSSSYVNQTIEYSSSRQVETPTEEIPPLPKWALWINPLGFLQFGPTIGLEVKTSGPLYLGTHFRYASMGALYNAIEGGYNSEVLMSAGAAGAALKYYIPVKGAPHAFYYGMFGEFAWGGHNKLEETYVSSDIRSYDITVEARSQSVVLGGTMGFRWRVGADRKVLLTLGILSGVAREVRDSERHMVTGTEYELPHDNVFFGMVELGIGMCGN